ncbi:hypothetical protein AgCh_005137 [Apium graveolens]
MENEGDSVVDNKDDAKDGVKDIKEENKDEEKVETEMDVDKEGTKELEKDYVKQETGKLEIDDVKEDSESKEEKQVEEPKSKGMEEENGEIMEGENEGKVENVPGLSVDNESADKDAEKNVSKRKRGKDKPKVDDEKTKIKKTLEKKKEEPKTPVALASDRPVRERKSVERLVASIEKDSGKEFHIEKGRGAALKDIPNVAYKLSRKKSEETYKLLHTILFNRRGKAAEVKSNISQFSGFVWHENEDKQKNKIKEKLDKCVKEKLLEFCYVLDLPISRANTKKEDIVTMLFEFLEAPQATTSELLADEELTSKGNKRKSLSKKSTSTSGSAPSKSSAKSNKRSASRGEDTPETDNDQEEQEDDVHGEQGNVDGSSDGSEDEKTERAKSEEQEPDTGAESEEETKKQIRVSSKKSSVKKNSSKEATPRKVIIVKKSSPPPKKAPSRPSSSHSKIPDSDTSPKSFTRKKTKVAEEKSPATPKKFASKDIAGKKVLKGEKKPKVEKLKPSDDELKIATGELLKEVDFNTATFTNILNLLGKRFNTDLIPRKSTIKMMVHDELIKLAEEEDEEVEALKDEKHASGPGLEV